MIPLGRSLSFPSSTGDRPSNSAAAASHQPRRRRKRASLLSLRLPIKMDRTIAAASTKPLPAPSPPSTSPVHRSPKLPASPSRACMPAASTHLILTSGAAGRVGAMISIRLISALVALAHAFLLLLLVPFHPFRYAAPVSAGPSKGKESGAVAQRKGKELVREVVGQEKKMELDVVAVPAPAPAPAPADGGRRELAARRVIEAPLDDADGVEGAGRSAAREWSVFRTARGDAMFTQSWSPVTVPAKGLVVLLHGLNEHSSRYNRFARQLNAGGFKVYAMDWIGHGGSDGVHGYVPNLDFAVNDMKAFLEKVSSENPGLPCFCFGHSTGGAIVLKASLDPKISSLIKGVAVTSPAVGVQPAHPVVTVLAPILSLLVPRYQFVDKDKKGMPVSRDPEALVAKYSDPLVFTGSIWLRTGSEILRITSFLQQNLHKLDVPFFVLHGTSDTVTDPGASQLLYQQAKSEDKSIKLYDGYLHDLLFEPERDDIARDIIDWMTLRMLSLQE